MVEQDEREREAFPLLEASIDYAYALLDGTNDPQDHKKYTAVPVAERLLEICDGDQDAVMGVLRVWRDGYMAVEWGKRPAVAVGLCERISILFGTDPPHPNRFDQALADEGRARGWRT